MDQTTQTNPGSGQTQESQTGSSDDSLAQIDARGTTIIFGIVPMVVIGLIILIGTVMYMIRKKRTEADLASAMTMDDGDGVKDTDTSNFTTRDMEQLDPTKPTNRIKKKD